MYTKSLVEKAKLAGFSKVLGSDSSGFVLLSRETDGRSGRKVFINAKLAPKFASLVDKDNEILIMHQLMQLKSIAGGMTSYSNIKNAFEHMHIVGNLKVAYKVIQFSGGANPSGVYITDVGFAGFNGDSQPGIYHVNYTKRMKWKLDDRLLSNIVDENIAINGLCENKIDAAEKIMPDMVENSYGKKVGIGAIRNSGYSLFYNPQGLRTFGKEWKSPEEKKYNSEHISNMLSSLMLAAQRNSKKVQWTIHGDGCRLFGEAIKKVSGQNLDNHDVIFLSPTDDAEMHSILANVRKLGISLHQDVMVTNTDDWNGTKNRTLIRARQIANEVRMFGAEYEYSAAVIEGQGMSNTVTAIGWLKLAGLGGLGVLANYKALRNMMAQGVNITNPSVNPHHHPFKSREQFNAHARVTTNNRVNTIVFTEILKRLRGK